MQQKHKKTAVILGAILIVLALFGGFFYSQADDTMRELSYESGEIYPYRAEIITKDGNDYYEKTYLFYDGEVPDESITESFRANGARWEYSHTEETPRMKALEKEYVHQVTFDSQSNDLKVLLGMLPLTKEITTEDGYQGVVYLNPSSVEAKAKGYKAKTVHLSETRSYYNLDSQDLSYVPKSITKNGEVYQLKDVSWQSINTETIDGYRLADRFTAFAEYEADVSRNYATGYTVTADYTGNVAKAEKDSVEYTLVFQKSKGIFAGHFLAMLLPLAATLAMAALSIFSARKIKEKTAAKKTIEERW